GSRQRLWPLERRGAVERPKVAVPNSAVIASGGFLPTLLAQRGRHFRCRASDSRQCRTQRARGAVAGARPARARSGRGDAARRAARSRARLKLANLATIAAPSQSGAALGDVGEWLKPAVC